jgi:hypothetical protein
MQWSFAGNYDATDPVILTQRNAKHTHTHTHTHTNSTRSSELITFGVQWHIWISHSYTYM